MFVGICNLPQESISELPAGPPPNVACYKRPWDLIHVSTAIVARFNEFANQFEDFLIDVPS